MGALDNLKKSFFQNVTQSNQVAPGMTQGQQNTTAQTNAAAKPNLPTTSSVRPLPGVANNPQQNTTPRIPTAGIALPTINAGQQNLVQAETARTSTVGQNSMLDRIGEGMNQVVKGVQAADRKAASASFKGQSLADMFSSLSSRTGAGAPTDQSNNILRFPTESTRRSGEELNKFYYERVEPAYKKYQQAEWAYKNGQMSYADYHKAQQEYQDVYNRYQPARDVWEKVSSTNLQDYFNTADPDDMAGTLEMYMSALDEGGVRLGEIQERYDNLSRSYEGDQQTFLASVDKLQAAKKALDTAEAAYKNRGLSQKKYQATFDQYQAAYEEYNTALRKMNSSGREMSELEGQLSAASLYYDAIAGATGYGSETYQRRYLELHPEVAYYREAGFTFNDAADVRSRLEEYQQGGQVDLTNRPTINANDLRSAGWKDVGTGDATVYSSTYSNLDFLTPAQQRRAAQHAAINLTPIVVDDTGAVVRILPPEELDEYARGILLEGKSDDLGLQIGAEFTGEGSSARAAEVAENIHKLHEAMLNPESLDGKKALLTPDFKDIYKMVRDLREQLKTAEGSAKEDLASKIATYNKIMQDGIAFANMDLDGYRDAREFFQQQSDIIQRELDTLSYVGDIERYQMWGEAMGGMPPVVPEGRDVQADIARYHELQGLQNDANDWVQRIQNLEYDLRYDQVLDGMNPAIRAKIEQYIAKGGQFEDRDEKANSSSWVLAQGNGPRELNGVLVPEVNPTQDEQQAAIDDIRGSLARAGYSDKEVDDIIYYMTLHANAERSNRILKASTEASYRTDSLTNFLLQRAFNMGKFTGALSIGAQNLFRGPDSFTGEAPPVDYYGDANLLAHQFRTIGEVEAQKSIAWVAKMYGMDPESAEVQATAKILNGAYNLFGSMADSTITKFMGVAGGDVGLLFMSMGAATDTMIEMHEKGYSDGAAFTSGVIAGLAEYWSENANLDDLLGLVTKAGKTGVNLNDVMRFLGHDAIRQGLSEGAEEVFSDVVNLIYDQTAGRLMNGGLTDINYSALQKQRENPNLTWDEAVRQSWTEWVAQCGEDYLGGFLSGWGMAGAGAVGGYYFGADSNRGNGAAVQGAGQHGDNSFALVQATQKMDNLKAKQAAWLNENLDRAGLPNIGRLLSGGADYQVLDAIDSRLQELGVDEKDISPELLHAINSAAGGDVLASGERKALRRNNKAQQVMRELRDYRDEMSSAAEEERSPSMSGQEEWAIQAEAKKELFKLQYTQSDVGAQTTAKRVTEQEQRYREMQAANPDANVLDPISEQLAEAGATPEIAARQGKLLDKIFSGETLTNKEMRALDLNNPAVRKVFAERSGLTGIPDGGIAEGLKRIYANQVSRESSLIQERQKAMADGAEMLSEQTAKNSQLRAEAMANASKKAPKNPFVRLFSAVTGGNQRRVNQATRQAEARALAHEDALNRLQDGMTEREVVNTIRRLYGIQVQTRTTMQALKAQQEGKKSYTELDDDARAATELEFKDYLRRLAEGGVPEQAIRALDKSIPNEAKVAQAGEVVLDSSVDTSKLYDENGRLKADDFRAAQIGVLERLAEALGLKIYLYESNNSSGEWKAVTDSGAITSDNGWFDPKDGSIHLDINAGSDGRGVILFTAAHELTHLLRRGNAEMYEQLKFFLFDRFIGRFGGGITNRLIDKQISKARRQGREIDPDTAEEEVVADAFEIMLASEDVAQTLIDMGNTSGELATEVVDYIHHLYDTINKFYADTNPDSEEGRRLAEALTGAFDDLRFMWAEGLAGAAQRYQEVAPKDIDGEPGTPQFSQRSWAQGAGFELGMDAEGKPEIYDENGKKVDKVTPEMVVNSPLGRLVQDAVRLQGLSTTDAKKQYKFIADMTNLIIQQKDAALVWEVAGSVMFSAIRANSDTQYKTTIDFSTICKKTQQIINVMSDAMKKVGHGLSRQDVEAAYEIIHKEGEQVPCPVCYVFSHWMGIGSILDDINRFQNKYWTANETDLQRLMERVERDAAQFAYEEVEKDPGKKKTYIWEKDGIQDGVEHKAGDVKIGRAISDMKQKRLGRDSFLEAQNTLNLIVDNQLRLRELEDPTLTTENLTPELAAQLARGNESSAARLRMRILESVLDSREYKKLAGRTLTKEDFAAYAEQIERKLRALEADIAKYREQLEPYEAYQFLNGTIMLHNRDGSWTKNKNYNRDRSGKVNGPVPAEILFDLNAGNEFAALYPDTWRYRTTRGNNAGKAMLPYSDERVGEIITGIGEGINKIESFDQTLNPFLYASTKKEQNKREKILNSAIEKQRRQNLIGGMRYQSTSDFRHQYGSDYLMSFFEMQAIGANVQLYTKVVEAVDFLASMGADCNLSVMPLNDGYVLDVNGNRKLVFSDVTGMNGDAAIALAHRYDNVQPILVGISDAHIRTAIHGTDITFVIPFHGSGNTTEQIQTLMGAVKESLSIGDTGSKELVYDEGRARDYTKTQSDKHLPNTSEDGPHKTAEQIGLWELRLSIIKGEAIPVTQKVQGKTVPREYFSFDEAYAELSPEHQELLGKSEYLRELFRRFYVKGADPRMHQCFLESEKAKQIFPYEYWDRDSTYTMESLPDNLRERFAKYLDPNAEYDMADVNGFRFQEYCESMGIIPRFSGVTNASTGVTYGRFVQDSGYWKLLIDRSMFENRYDANGKWIGYGKYRDQEKINVTNFKAETIDPGWAGDNYGDVMVRDTDASKTEMISDQVVARIRAGEAMLRGEDADGPTAEEIIDQLESHEFVTPETGEAVKSSIRENQNDWNPLRDKDGNVVLVYKAFYAYQGGLYPPMISNLSDSAKKKKVTNAVSGTLNSADTPVGVVLDAEVGKLARYAKDATEYEVLFRTRWKGKSAEIEQIKDEMKAAGYDTKNLTPEGRAFAGSLMEQADSERKEAAFWSRWKRKTSPTIKRIKSELAEEGFDAENLTEEGKAAAMAKLDQYYADLREEAILRNWKSNGKESREFKEKLVAAGYDIEGKAFYDLDETTRNAAIELMKLPRPLQSYDRLRNADREKIVERAGELVRNASHRLAVENSKGGGTLAFRPGWHLGQWPNLTQFNITDPLTGKEKSVMPDSLVFCACEIAGDIDYQLEAMELGMTENGGFDRTQAGLPYVPVNGYYKYRTNADPTTEPWYITGAIKVVSILDDEDCRRICAQYGITPQPRASHKDIDLAAYGLKRGPVTPLSPDQYQEYGKSQAAIQNEEVLREALADPNYQDAYVSRRINFDNKEIQAEFARNYQDAEYYRKKYEELGDPETRKAREVQHSSRDFQPRLVLEESTVNKYLADYAAKSNPNYAQAYITYMSPSQFLDLTTSVAGRISVQQSARPLDAQQLGENSRVQPIFLRINTETGEVEGHEGRHRMVALNREGVDEIPVLLFDSRNKYSKVPLESLTLTGQDFGNQRSYDTVTVTNVLPLSYANREAIISRFATPTSREQVKQKYGSGDLLRYSTRDGDVDIAARAAEELDKRYGKGTAKNIEATTRKLQKQLETMQKQLEIEREQKQAARKQLTKELAEKKKVAGKYTAAQGQIRALKAEKTEAKNQIKEMQKQIIAIQKQMADMAIDNAWNVGLAASKGEQKLKATRRFYDQQVIQARMETKEQKRAAQRARREAEANSEAGLRLAEEERRKGKKAVREAERAADQLLAEEQRKHRADIKAGLELAEEEHRIGKRNYRWALKCAKGYLWAMEGERKAKSHEEWLRSVLSLPGRSMASEQRKYAKKSKQVMINGGTQIYQPLPGDNNPPPPPKGLRGIGSKILTKLRDGYNKFHHQMIDDTDEVSMKFAKLQTRTDSADVMVNVVRASSSSVETCYTEGLIDREGNIIGPSLQELLLCYDTNGKFSPELQAILQEYMFNQHNIDRMSLETRAVQRVQEFLAQPTHSWITRRSPSQLAQLYADGNEIVREYYDLISWANKVKNKAVMPNSDNYAKTAEESRATVEQIEAEYPWVVEKANQIYDTWDRFMREWAVGTSISLADYEDMRTMYPHYVPTYRAEDGEKIRVTQRGPDGRLTTGELVRTAEGSLKPLMNLEDQFVKKTREIIRGRRENEFVQNIVEEFLYDDAGDFSQYGVFDMEGRDNDELSGMWDYDEDEAKARVETFKLENKDVYRISCWVNGERLSAYVTKAMYDSIRATMGMRDATKQGLIDAGRKVTRIPKAAITGYNPTFAIKNPFRDIHTALTNSRAGIMFFAYYGKAAKAIYQNADTWVNFQALGGVSANRTRVEGGFANAMKPATGMGKAKQGFETIFGKPGEITEAVTRFAEYLAVIDLLGGDTYENRMAAIRAAAEVTVDFSRAGETGRVINAWCLYWNPNIQGIDKMIRNIAEQPTWKGKLGRLGRAALVNAIPAALQAALIAALGRWKDYEELSDRQKDSYYCFPTKEHKFLKIPKSQDWAAFISTPFLRILEGVNGRDNIWENWFESALVPNLPFDTVDIGLGVELPVIMPVLVDDIVELLTNEDYAGGAIIPYNLQEASSKEQYDADTTLLARFFGEVFRMSPMAVDYIAGDIFGNFWGTWLSTLTSTGVWTGEESLKAKAKDAVITSMSPFFSDNRYSNSTMARYYSLLDALEQEITDAGVHGDQKDAEHYYIYKALNQSGGYVDQIRALTSEAREYIRGEAQAEIRWEAVGLAAEAMDFVQKCISGEIEDPEHWMTYAHYGDLIYEEATDLKNLEATNDGSFNFSGKLGEPKTIYDRSGDVDIKYNLDPKFHPGEEDTYVAARQEYVRIREAEYKKALELAIRADDYDGLTPEQRAARLEEAKRIGLQNADRKMLEYLAENKIQGEDVGKANYDAERREAAYSVAWLLGEQNAYKPELTEEFLNLYDYHDQYSFIPSSSSIRTFKDPNDTTKTKVFVLDAEQQRMYAEIYHDTITEIYDDVLKSSEYRTAGTELRAAMLARAKTYYANDLIKERFAEYLKSVGAAATTQDKASPEISLEAKYAIQRAMGDDNAMSKRVTDELVRLYQYSDAGEMEYFPITTAPKSYADDQHKGQMWVLTEPQREVYMSMMYDIYQRNILEVVGSQKYLTADNYTKAQMLGDVRARLAGETQAEFKKWLRDNKVPTVSKKSHEQKARDAELSAVAKTVDQILGSKARTYKQFSEGRGYTQPKKKKKK